VVFRGGWGAGTPNNGRVADLIFAPDGRMFFSDDQDGAVYWVAPRMLRMP
jgi:glucose/arabinose dehydrogenase